MKKVNEKESWWKGKGEKEITFKLPAAADSKYEIMLAYNSNEARAQKVPVEIHHAGGVSKVFVNMRKPPEYKGKFTSLGQYSFKSAKQAKVVISNEGTHGFVIVDAIRMIPHGVKTDVNEGKLNKYTETYISELRKTVDEIISLKAPTPLFSTPVVSTKSPSPSSTSALFPTFFADTFT